MAEKEGIEGKGKEAGWVGEGIKLNPHRRTKKEDCSLVAKTNHFLAFKETVKLSLNTNILIQHVLCWMDQLMLDQDGSANQSNIVHLAKCWIEIFDLVQTFSANILCDKQSVFSVKPSI